ASNKPKHDNEYTFDNNQDSNNPSANNNYNNGNKFFQNPSQQQPAAEGKKSFNKNLIPTIILVVVFIVFFAYHGGYLNFNSSNPVGRWIYEMDEGEESGGFINLTDYWYMEFYENGTLDIGWKNVDYPEDSQGSGSWYVEGGVIYVTIHYNNGDTVQAEFVIKSNQLVEYGTNIPSEYYRE
ncbi:MAG: hypothetical protein RQ856_01640, partial [Candidatus Izemoplasmatales bacterium]|nr:hypothetical protein [Candidatus Izemoplasmatales bacterium]